MDQFERAKSHLLLEDRHFPESFYVEAFISGWKDEIKPFVIAFNPITLADAFDVSLQMEAAYESQYRKMKGPIKNFGVGPVSHIKPINDRMKVTNFNTAPPQKIT
jgi:hypothetical protein